MEQYRDEHIVCANCGESFLFSGAEAGIFAERGLASPKRCKECRRARKEQAGNAPGHRAPGGPRRDFDGRAPRQPAGRYTGDVNEYRSPMQDPHAPSAQSRGGNVPAPRGPRRAGPGAPSNVGAGWARAFPQGRAAAQTAGAPRRPARNDGEYRAPMQHEGRDGNANRKPAAAAAPDLARPPHQPHRRPPAEKFSITCSSCGETAQVPFKPADGREVFCQACYRARKPVV